MEGGGVLGPSWSDGRVWNPTLSLGEFQPYLWSKGFAYFNSHMVYLRLLQVHPYGGTNITPCVLRITMEQLMRSDNYNKPKCFHITLMYGYEALVIVIMLPS